MLLFIFLNLSIQFETKKINTLVTKINFYTMNQDVQVHLLKLREA